jgi:hypothetical protein
MICLAFWQPVDLPDEIELDLNFVGISSWQIIKSKLLILYFQYVFFVRTRDENSESHVASDSPLENDQLFRRMDDQAGISRTNYWIDFKPDRAK